MKIMENEDLNQSKLLFCMLIKTIAIDALFLKDKKQQPFIIIWACDAW